MAQVVALGHVTAEIEVTAAGIPDAAGDDQVSVAEIAPERIEGPEGPEPMATQTAVVGQTRLEIDVVVLGTVSLFMGVLPGAPEKMIACVALAPTTKHVAPDVGQTTWENEAGAGVAGFASSVHVRVPASPGADVTEMTVGPVNAPAVPDPNAMQAVALGQATWESVVRLVTPVAPPVTVLCVHVPAAGAPPTP
jgi:hypothetical protein